MAQVGPLQLVISTEYRWFFAPAKRALLALCRRGLMTEWLALRSIALLVRYGLKFRTALVPAS